VRVENEAVILIFLKLERYSLEVYSLGAIFIGNEGSKVEDRQG
jgi:hypothetical protein